METFRDGTERTNFTDQTRQWAFVICALSCDLVLSSCEISPSGHTVVSKKTYPAFRRLLTTIAAKSLRKLQESYDMKVIFECHNWLQNAITHVSPRTPWREELAEAGIAGLLGEKKQEEIFQYCLDLYGDHLHMRAIQGHSGGRHVDPSLQDKYGNSGPSGWKHLTQIFFKSGLIVQGKDAEEGWDPTRLVRGRVSLTVRVGSRARPAAADPEGARRWWFLSFSSVSLSRARVLTLCVDMECTMTGTPGSLDPKRLVIGPCWNLFVRFQLFESLSLCCCHDVPCEDRWYVFDNHTKWRVYPSACRALVRWQALVRSCTLDVHCSLPSVLWSLSVSWPYDVPCLAQVKRSSAMCFTRTSHIF